MTCNNDAPACNRWGIGALTDWAVSMVQFKPIPSCPGYFAGDDGSIIGKSGKILKPLRHSAGYLRFTAFIPGFPKGKPVYIHAAVCEAFHGPRPTPDMEVAHGNGVPTDNRPGNLSWKTRKGNCHDKRRHGTHREGERVPTAKLTDASVWKILDELGHLPSPAVAEMFGISSSVIRHIRLGRAWRHIR